MKTRVINRGLYFCFYWKQPEMNYISGGMLLLSTVFLLYSKYKIKWNIVQSVITLLWCFEEKYFFQILGGYAVAENQCENVAIQIFRAFNKISIRKDRLFCMRSPSLFAFIIQGLQLFQLNENLSCIAGEEQSQQRRLALRHTRW